MHSFSPPDRTLMGPGPSDVHPRILQAMARPTIGHLDPEFVRMMDETKELIRNAFQSDYALAMPVSAPGSAGMETCFVNLLEPGDKVIICQNGAFGGRMKENAERCGAIPEMVEDEWGQPIDLNKVETALKAHTDAKVLAFVHAETSTGAISDVENLARLATENGCLSIADTVTSLGGSPLRVSDWGLDAVYSGSQKCLSCTPGLSPITLSPAAVEVVKNRKTKVQSWFLDLNLVLGYWDGEGGRSYHHTAPINALYGLHEALLILKEEGLHSAWARHDRNYLAFRAGIEAMGLSFVVPEAARLPQLNAIQIPDGVDDATVRKSLLNEYDLEIGAGLGVMAGKIWRIGLMGYSSRRENVLLCLKALDETLTGLGAQMNSGTGVEAAEAYYNR